MKTVFNVYGKWISSDTGPVSYTHLCPLALAFRPVPFHVPKRLRDVLFATELRHSSVDCHPPHDRDNTCLLYTSNAIMDIYTHFICRQ